MYRRQKKTSKNFHFQPKTNVNLTSETDVNVTSIQLILPAGQWNYVFNIQCPSKKWSDKDM